MDGKERYQPPASNRLISPAEREYIATAPGSEIPAASTSFSWLNLFRYRQVWGLMAVKFFTDAAWFFFIFWLPKYLGDVRNLDIKQIGYFAWIPYAIGGIGSLLGGWLSSFLTRLNFGLSLSRKIALALGASLMPVSLFIASAPLQYAIIFFSVAMFAHQFWSANLQTLPADIFPARVVGSVGGLLGSAGSFGGMLFGFLVGRIVEHHGYGPVFAIASVLHPLAFLLILTIVGRIEAIGEN